MHSLDVISMHVSQDYKCFCGKHSHVLCYYYHSYHGFEIIPVCANSYSDYFGNYLSIESTINKYEVILFLIIKLVNIPKDILFYIGKKYYKQPQSIYNESGIALFNTTCERARSAIRTFCLYCIRYQKGKVNRDLRRKISELLWNDKIQWLE